jgi:preprotein translocase subunit SecA
MQMECDDADMLRYQRAVQQINKREPAMRAKSDAELRAMTDELRARCKPPKHHPTRKPRLSLVPKTGDTPS